MERLKQLRWSSIKKPSVMALAFMLVHVSPALSDWPHERASLAGLTGVTVVVEGMRPDAEREGLRQSTLQTDVELKLRQAGIRVLTEAERILTPGIPRLYLNVNTMLRDEIGAFAFSINLRLMQKVRLDRNPIIVSEGTTWSTGSVGTVGVRELATVRESIRDQVDEFINAYLAANPKR
jgi:hypothetical protein